MDTKIFSSSRGLSKALFRKKSFGKVVFSFVRCIRTLTDKPKNPKAARVWKITFRESAGIVKFCNVFFDQSFLRPCRRKIAQRCCASCLGCPQTHLTLKGLLREANKDPNTGEVTFREFLAVFRKASSEEIDEESPLKQLATLNEIDVGEKGVVGAKEFFQVRIPSFFRVPSLV